MRSDEEDGSFEGLSGWIVQPPWFHSQQLATLQTPLEASPTVSTIHLDRVPPNKYDLDATDETQRHFWVHLMQRLWVLLEDVS